MFACLMVVIISVKFDENISHSFQVTKGTGFNDQNYYSHCSKGQNSKSR